MRVGSRCLRGLATLSWPAQKFFTPFHIALNKRSQLFIRSQNETLSVVAMCVSNPDRSPVAINR
jgi:hypothetical protein